MAFGLTQSATLVQGQAKYLSISNASQTGLGFTGDCTIEAWLKLSTFSSSQFFTKWDTASNLSYLFSIDSATSVSLTTTSNGSSVLSAAVIVPTLTTSVWTHFAVTFKSSTHTMEVFINGVSQGTATGSLATTIFSGTSPVGVGSRPGAAVAQITGQMSLTRAWNVVRTQAQISANMCNVLGSTTNLQAEWTLNNVLTDNSGNGNTLTNTGSVPFAADVPSICSAVVNGNFIEFM